MPTISYDGQSFNIDGRRIWLVSGAIHYARTPRQLWRARIRAAKEAGLNCIETYVFWNLHEPRPGHFDFQGDKDLRAFVQTVAQEGLYCIVRPGPYVCAEWDFGGLPAWLHRTEGVRLRQANGPFLEACGRYFGAVFEQIKDLQVNDNPARTANGSPAGPIIMVQAENEWISHNPDQVEPYLAELVRYLRESGCSVPINICNNLWQRVPGTLDTWNSNQYLAFDLRQLRIVQPNAPRMVSEFWPGWFDRWGAPHHREFDGDWNLYRLAQILGVGAQYNLYMFHGGTNFGFWGGRTIASPDCFMTTSYDYDAPLLEAGGRGPKYLAIKKISTFASQFGHVFAAFDPDAAPPAVAPDDDAHHPLCLLHQSGPQGDVVFLLKSKEDTTEATRVLLPNGLNLPIPLGPDRVAWFAMGVKLTGNQELTYTNLRPWAFVARKLLVLFGPPDAEGLISLNDAPLKVRVPTGQVPLVERHEDITIVVLNSAQVDAAYLLPTGLVVGAAGLDLEDRPLALEGWSTTYTIDLAGAVTKSSLKAAKTPAAPKLGKWSAASVAPYLDGSSAAYQPIDGPKSLETLGCDYGYGWYRLTAPADPPNAPDAIAPQSGDRLHLFNNGKPIALLGLGPGAQYDPAPLKLGKNTVVLADNMGRFNFGWLVGESKGLFGHILNVKPLKLAKPEIVAERAPDPFTQSGFVLYIRRGERPASEAAVLRFSLTKIKCPILLDIQGLNAKAMVFLNGQPLGMYDRGFTAQIGRFVIPPGPMLKPGKNEIKLAFFQKPSPDIDLLEHIRLYEATANLTETAQWAFAPWVMPAAEEFAPLDRATASGVPTWYRTTFGPAPAAVPMWLEPQGLTKGQLYLNGHNLGRFFVATASGKAVPPQERYYLPEPWLNTDKPNELTIFEEHGRHPGKARLVYDPMGPYGE